MAIPEVGKDERHQLFSDSIVTGAANPMGLGGYLWREGDVAVQEVTLGKAFEGAPGRAHGGNHRRDHPTRPMGLVSR